MKKVLPILLICFSAIAVENVQILDGLKAIKWIAKTNGYKIEEHRVLTEDNYWLVMHRVYNPVF